MMTSEDLRALDDAALTALYDLVIEETGRRRAQALALEAVAQAQWACLIARDGDQPPEGAPAEADQYPRWVKPSGAHDSYPVGYVVQGPDGTLLRSRVPSNDRGPGHRASWERVQPQMPDVALEPGTEQPAPEGPDSHGVLAAADTSGQDPAAP